MYEGSAGNERPDGARPDEVEQTSSAVEQEPTAGPAGGEYPADRPDAAPIDRPAAAPFEQPAAGSFDQPAAAPYDRPAAPPIEQPATSFDQPAAAPYDRPVAGSFEQPAAAPVERPAERTVAGPVEYPTPPAYRAAPDPQQAITEPALVSQAEQPRQPSGDSYPTQQYPAQQPYGAAPGAQQTQPGQQPYGVPAFGQSAYGSGGTPQSPGAFGAPPTPDEPGRRRPALMIGALVLAAALVGGVVGGVIVHETTHSNTNDVASSFANSGTGSNTSSGPATGDVEKVAQSLLPSVVNISYNTSNGQITGSGDIISADGEILTNNHVVADAVSGGDTITVTFNDGSTTTATVLGRDSIFDLAVIKAKNVTNLKPVQFGNSSALKVGQEVVAIGSPLGLQGTVTSGIVSAMNRPVDTTASTQQDTGSTATTVIDAVQTDAAINPGNSGGPLVDMSGRVIGINAAIATASENSGLGGGQSGSIGIGFAIPIDEAARIADSLAHGQQPVHAQLDVNVQSQNNSNVSGAQIQSVVAGGPAANAGIQTNDVITKVNSRTIPDSDTLIAAIRDYQPGTQVQVTYVRGGSSHTVTVTLGSAADSSN